MRGRGRWLSNRNRGRQDVSAYLAVRFLMRFFETNRLTPFAIYCTVAGAALTIGFIAT